MFNRILVALDGSGLAEYAIEPAFVIARRFGSQVTLLRVIGRTGPDSPYPAMNAIDAEFDRAEAEDYLRLIEARFLSSGLKVQTEVVAGEPAPAITAAAAEQKVDLIIMSTHGRSGLMRLLYGSVAEAVLRGAHSPVMLIPIKGQPVLA